MVVASYTSAQTITPGIPVYPGHGFMVSCQAEGTLSLIMRNGTTLELYLYPGTFQFDGISVKDVNGAGTSATCHVAVLYRDS
jgi:hypothetical protein